jgi:hypothetical protein
MSLFKPLTRDRWLVDPRAIDGSEQDVARRMLSLRCLQGMPVPDCITIVVLRDPFPWAAHAAAVWQDTCFFSAAPGPITAGSTMIFEGFQRLGVWHHSGSRLLRHTLCSPEQFRVQHAPNYSEAHRLACLERKMQHGSHMGTTPQ